jgi:endogenous inhibitor of DNA gyrase (YacG/DUF329 family)
MSRDPNSHDVTMPQLECPTCGAPTEIIDRFTLYGVPEPVDHVKVRCVVGHWYTIPTDWVPSAGRDSQVDVSSRRSAVHDDRQSVSPFSSTSCRRLGRPSTEVAKRS